MRAAQWMLTHHPHHRMAWGNQEQINAAIESTLARVCKGLEIAGLTLEQQRRALMGMRAAGVGMPDQADPADG